MTAYNHYKTIADDVGLLMTQRNKARKAGGGDWNVMDFAVSRRLTELAEGIAWLSKALSEAEIKREKPSKELVRYEDLFVKLSAQYEQLQRQDHQAAEESQATKKHPEPEIVRSESARKIEALLQSDDRAKESSSKRRSVEDTIRLTKDTGQLSTLRKLSTEKPSGAS